MALCAPDPKHHAPHRYVLSAQETRSVVLSESPGLSLGEIGKTLGARWKGIDPEDKVAF